MTEPGFKISSLQEAKQAAFNGAVRGLSWQEWKRCMRPEAVKNGCVLSDGQGRHCAVGWLIPEDKQPCDGVGDSWTAYYNKLLHPAFISWLNSRRWTRGTALNNPLKEGIEFKGFLAHLQNAHDDAVSAEHMKNAFIRIGKNHKLVWPKDVES